VDEEDRRAKQGCERFLSRHIAASPARLTESLARHPAAREPADLYGESGAVAGRAKGLE
jgi:hypothetical protein